MVVCLLTVNAPIYQGPVSKLLSDADLSWILGLPVSAATYVALARRTVRATAAEVPLAHVRAADALGEAGAIHESVLAGES